jgi:hypothetical protein
MCLRCDNIDARIRHYQKLSRLITDQTVLDSIDALIAEMEAQKALLHQKPVEG